jgi:hypothetical protein
MKARINALRIAKIDDARKTRPPSSANIQRVGKPPYCNRVRLYGGCRWNVPNQVGRICRLQRALFYDLWTNARARSRAWLATEPPSLSIPTRH